MDQRCEEQSLSTVTDVEQAVRSRYSSASQQREPSLCCPVQYDKKYLAILPEEILEKDYGCGDPSRYVQQGETVLDLGSGGGKVCYIASQIVGRQGKVIGVDMNDEMLALANKYREPIGDQLGYHNVQFLKGRIQDLGLDLGKFEAHLDGHPIASVEDWFQCQVQIAELCQRTPMISNASIDVIVSNCVLNLVDPHARRQMFSEMHRVLRDGGRAVISDIVSDEPVPTHMRNDPSLWSGCISGAYVEHEFLAAFAEAGFYGMEIVDRPQKPWATIEGIEFRSVTVRAYKGLEGPCRDYNHAVLYQGPWESVIDDDGHTLRRGVPMAVCKKNFDIYTRAPYSDQVIGIPPRQPVTHEQARSFNCRENRVRSPRETKGENLGLTQLPADCCGGSC